MPLLAQFLRENRFTTEQLPTFKHRLFFDGGQRRPYLERFGVLLLLSVIIATAGIIGARIVAPLMLPIMATTAALVSGRMDRAARCSWCAVPPTAHGPEQTSTS